jgi:hypothetical protein
MRVIWFILLAVLAFGLGAFGGAAWNLTKSGLQGLRVVCEVTATAEKSGLLTRAQLSDAVSRLAKRVESSGISKGEASIFFDELKAGCPNRASLGNR